MELLGTALFLILAAVEWIFQWISRHYTEIVLTYILFAAILVQAHVRYIAGMLEIHTRKDK